MKQVSTFSVMAANLLFVIMVLGVPLVQSSSVTHIHYLHLPNGVVGPETVVFDCEGKGPYTGVSDGRILKWEGFMKKWMTFATVAHGRPSCNASTVDTSLEASCGRPLGLKFNPKTCELYIADAYYGLMKVGRNGGVATPLVSNINAAPMRFLNDLDIDPTTGVVYFTDSSKTFYRWQWPLIVATMDRTGRLISYDPCNGNVSVLLHRLAFPNGVALGKDGNFLLWTETTTMQVHKYWLTGPKRHTDELILQLNGYPDNINRNVNGDFWVAVDLASPVKIDSFGKVLEVLKDTDDINDISEINNVIWIGSLTKSYIEVRS